MCFSWSGFLMVFGNTLDGSYSLCNRGYLNIYVYMDIQDSYPVAVNHHCKLD